MVAPAASSLLGLVSRLAPVIVSGNAAVVVASETRPLPAITLAEVLATSDLPGGVVNLLTGFAAELVGPLAAHMDVDALDLAGLDLALYREAELAAAENVKRVVPPVKLSVRDWLSDAKGQDPYWIAAFLETKTVWHPIGVSRPGARAGEIVWIASGSIGLDPPPTAGGEAIAGGRQGGSPSAQRPDGRDRQPGQAPRLRLPVE